eukprot:4319948-Pyramimonas_sp.AAC.1
MKALSFATQRSVSVKSDFSTETKSCTNWRPYFKRPRQTRALVTDARRGKLATQTGGASEISVGVASKL